MQTQNQNSKSGIRNGAQPFGINYKYVGSRGRLYLGRSVGTGRDQAHAERRFFSQHRHVMREDAGCTVAIVPLLVAFAFLFVVITILAVELVQANRVIRENNASVEDQLARRMQYLQTNSASLTPRPSTLDPSEGGAK